VNACFASFVKNSLLRTGHYSRALKRDQFPGVATLCYHGVCPDHLPPTSLTFEGLHVRASELNAHCLFLRKNCHPISLQDWCASIHGGSRLPDRPVLVTFDDAYRTVVSQALPILKRFAMPAVVFVCTDPVERRELLWYDELARRHGEGEVERAKSLPFEQWQAMHEAGRHPVSDDDPNAVCTIEEVRALSRVEGITIGSHTAAHPILARGDRRQQCDQIVASKTCLEQWTQKPVRAFAYPNGRPGQDYTLETVEVLREWGFEIAFTTRPAFATASESPLEYSRFLMLAGVSEAELAHRLSYSWRNQKSAYV
jgi:peptidoglycan/xylan/chitin deacetylase (PgdA/CDA1 family)